MAIRRGDCPSELAARRAGHQSPLLPRRFDRIAAAHAVRAFVAGIEGIGDAPRWPARPCSKRRDSGYRGRVGPNRHVGRGVNRRRPPGRHHMGRRLRRLASRRSGIARESGGRPCRKPFLPCRGAIGGRRAPGLACRCRRPAGSHMHDLDHPAAGGPATPRNRERLAPIAGHGLVVPEAGEDVVLVVHGRPVLRGGASRMRHDEPW